MEYTKDGVRHVLHKYRALLALVSIALLAELGYATLNFSALPVYVQYELRAGKALGLILSAFLLTEALFRPAFGALGDRLGRKPLLLLGPCISMFTAILTVHFENAWVLVVLRVLDGLGSAAIWPSAFAVISDVVEEKNRSTAMGTLNVTYMIGIALGPLLGGLTNDLAGSYQASFYLVSFIFFLSFVLGMFVFPREAGKPHKVDLPESEQHSFKMSDLLHSFQIIPEMLLLSFVTFVGIGLLMPIGKLYAMTQYHMSETQFGAALTPVAAALAIFALPLGRLGDKWGKGRSVCWGITASAVAMWGIATLYNIVIAGICAAILGIGFVAAFPSWLALISEQTTPRRRGEVLGAVGTAQGLGSIFGAAAGAYLYNSHHLNILNIESIHLPFYGSAILLSIASIMSFGWVCNARRAKCKINN